MPCLPAAASPAVPERMSCGGNGGLEKKRKKVTVSKLGACLAVDDSEGRKRAYCCLPHVRIRSEKRSQPVSSHTHLDLSEAGGKGKI